MQAKDLRLRVIQDLLADLYDLYPLRLDLADIGHSGCSRERVYVVIASKKLRMIANPQQLFDKLVPVLRAMRTTQPSDYLTAQQDEVEFEAFEYASSSRQTCRNFWVEVRGL